MFGTFRKSLPCLIAALQLPAREGAKILQVFDEPGNDILVQPFDKARPKNTTQKLI